MFEQTATLLQDKEEEAKGAKKQLSEALAELEGLKVRYFFSMLTSALESSFRALPESNLAETATCGPQEIKRHPEIRL